MTTKNKEIHFGINKQINRPIGKRTCMNCKCKFTSTGRNNLCPECNMLKKTYQERKDMFINKRIQSIFMVAKKVIFYITKVSDRKLPKIYKNILKSTSKKQKQYYLLNGGLLGTFRTVESAKREANKRAQKGLKNKRPVEFDID